MDDRGDRKMKKDLLVFFILPFRKREDTPCWYFLTKLRWWFNVERWLCGVHLPSSLNFWQNFWNPSHETVPSNVERWLWCGVHLSSSVNFCQNFWNLSHETVPLNVKRWLLCAGYFSGALGPGQLGMFNLLKAYSILDHEVGYCQVRPILYVSEIHSNGSPWKSASVFSVNGGPIS